MKEIEVKVLEINKSKIETQLKKMGAKIAFNGVIDSVSMDFPDKRLHKKGELLRLRKMGKKNIATYKIKSKKSKKAKVCEEMEFETEDFEKTKKVFELLGLKQSKGMKKHRTSYTLGKTHFEIETYLGEHKHVPVFLEIEAPNIKLIYEYAKELGINKEKCLNWNSQDVTKHYAGKKDSK